MSHGEPETREPRLEVGGTAGVSGRTGSCSSATPRGPPFSPSTPATGPPPAEKRPIEVKDLGAKLAAMLGTDPKQIMINDMAVNPLSGNVYLSLSRGRGPDATPLLVRVNADGKIEEVPLEKRPLRQGRDPQRSRRRMPRNAARACAMSRSPTSLTWTAGSSSPDCPTKNSRRG